MHAVGIERPDFSEYVHSHHGEEEEEQNQDRQDIQELRNREKKGIEKLIQSPSKAQKTKEPRNSEEAYSAQH